MKRSPHRLRHGFTLAELLIALAILGVIATFTIPKVLQGQQSSKHKSIAKEAAGAIASAFDAYRLNTPVSASTSAGDLTPFFNYVRLETGIQIDSYPTQPAINCSSGVPCMVLHNGAILKATTRSFGGTGSTNCTFFYFDPDGQYSGSAGDGPGKGVLFHLYPNGLLRTRGTVLPNSTDSSATTYNPDSTLDPSWFSWD